MPRRTRGEFGWSEGGMATTEVIKSERLICFLGKRCLFYHELHELSND